MRLSHISSTCHFVEHQKEDPTWTHLTSPYLLNEAGGGSTVVEHSPQHLKVKGSSAADTAGTGREKKQGILKGEVSLYC